MKMDSLEALLQDQLKDLYSAENQLVKALPKLAKKASSPALRRAFETHLEQTREHVERLQEIGDSLGVKLGGKKCHAMEGLIEEGEEVLDAKGEEAVIDAALVGAAQRVEHYEISAYGTARAVAERLGLDDAARLLQRTLDEESETDEKLTRISEDELLVEAAAGTGDGAEQAQRSGNSGRRRATR